MRQARLSWRSAILAAACLSLLAFTGCCCPAIDAARQSALRNASASNMREILMGVINYESATKRWPETLEDARKFIENFDEVIVNPVTKDSPGYEYVKPDRDARKKGYAQVVILYQLRDGQRDESLAVGYADAHIEMGH